MSDVPAADPYSAAVDRMRATAQWLITLFGALGAVLIAGTQLSSIGKLELPADWLYLALALVGGVVALAAIARIIWAATNVLTAGEVTLTELADDEKTAKDGSVTQWLKAQELLGEFTSVEAFVSRRDSVRRELAPRVTEDHPSKLTDERIIALDPVQARLNEITDTVTSGARYYKVSRELARTRRTMLWAGALAAGGATLFAWAVNPPEPPPAPAAAFALPAAGQMTLTKSGQELLASTLGRACVDSTPVRVIVVGTTPESFDVVSIPSGMCRLSRFRLTGSMGAIVPADTVVVSPSTGRVSTTK